MDNAEVWAGEFGDAYHFRQKIRIEHIRALFEEALGNAAEPDSILEFGAGEGYNLEALGAMYPCATLTGIEPNAGACEKMLSRADVVMQGTIQEFEPAPGWDLVFTKGVLIHIPPGDIFTAYRVLYESSADYIVMSEYFSPTPTEVKYRGRKGLMWKRDFGSELWDLYPSLRFQRCFFTWHRSAHPQDNLTTWVFRK